VDVPTLHRRAVELWEARVSTVADDQWEASTPCTGWNVRDLVNHVVGEELWTAPLLEGSTIEQVGSRFDGDVLGDDPVATSHRAARTALAAVDENASVRDTVHLSYGDESTDEYLCQLAADHLVHGWDLAVATGGDPSLAPDLVDEVAVWFAGRESAYRASGAIGPHVEVRGDAQTELLAAFGRDARWAARV